MSLLPSPREASAKDLLVKRRRGPTGMLRKRRLEPIYQQTLSAREQISFGLSQSTKGFANSRFLNHGVTEKKDSTCSVTLLSPLGDSVSVGRFTECLRTSFESTRQRTSEEGDSLAGAHQEWQAEAFPAMAGLRPKRATRNLPARRLAVPSGLWRRPHRY